MPLFRRVLGPSPSLPPALSIDASPRAGETPPPDSFAAQLARRRGFVGVQLTPEQEERDAREQQAIADAVDGVIP